MTCTKVIFLDFDGPLSNHRVTFATGDMKAFDPVTVAMLNKICELTEAKIVCTSTRAPLNNPDSHGNTIRRFTEARLNLGHLHEDWSCRYDNRPREGHITKWLAEHPEVTEYVAVDDRPCAVKNLIRVDPYNGLTVQDAIRILEVFRVDPQKFFDDIGRQNAGNDDPAYRVSKIKLPPPQP